VERRLQSDSLQQRLSSLPQQSQEFGGLNLIHLTDSSAALCKTGLDSSKPSTDQTHDRSNFHPLVAYPES